MIWHATEEDLFGLVEMGARFHRGADMDGEYRDADFWRFCKDLIDGDDGCVIRSDRGMIGGQIARLPWDSEHTFGAEWFWWSEDWQGPRLLEAFENWAWPKGARDVRVCFLSHMKPVAVGRLLSRMGYEGREMTMVKTCPAA